MRCVTTRCAVNGGRRETTGHVIQITGATYGRGETHFDRPAMPRPARSANTSPPVTVRIHPEPRSSPTAPFGKPVRSKALRCCLRPPASGLEQIAQPVTSLWSADGPHLRLRCGYACTSAPAALSQATPTATRGGVSLALFNSSPSGHPCRADHQGAGQERQWQPAPRGGPTHVGRRAALGPPLRPVQPHPEPGSVRRGRAPILQ